MRLQDEGHSEPVKYYRRIPIIMLGVGVAILLWTFLRPREQEPRYEGRTLSQWLMDYDPTPKPDGPLTKQANSAVEHIGTNALPSLIKWIDYEVPAWHWKFCDAFPRVAASPTFSRLVMGKKDFLRARAANLGFKILGDKAAPAVPKLTQMLATADTRTKSEALGYALVCVGKDGLTALVTVVTNPIVSSRARRLASRSLDWRGNQLGTNGSWMVPILIRALDQDDEVTQDIAFFLGNLKMMPELAVPALIQCLSSKRRETRMSAVASLGEFGKVGQEAKSGITALVFLTTSDVLQEREVATNALREIAPELLQEAKHF
jgi:HEAT repeat protein